MIKKTIPLSGKRRAKADNDLPKKVIQLAEAMGFMAWRANSGSVKTESGSWIKLSPAGTPDILAVIPGSNGRLLGIECKSETGTLSPSQKAWHERAKAAGAEVVTVRSLREAQMILRALSPKASVGQGS